MKKIKIYISYLRIKYHYHFENFINLIKFLFRINRFLWKTNKYSILDSIYVKSAEKLLNKYKITREMVYYKLKHKHKCWFLFYSAVFALVKGAIIIDLVYEQVKDRFERWEIADDLRLREIWKSNKQEYRFFKKLFKKIHFYLNQLSCEEMHALLKKADIRLYRFMFDRIVKKEDYDYVINKTIGINDTTCKTLFEESMDKNLNSASVYISFHDKISNFFRKIFGKKEKDQTSIDGGELHDVLFKNKE